MTNRNHASSTHEPSKLCDLFMSYSRIQARCPAQVLSDGFTLRSVASHSAHFARLGWLKRVGTTREARFIRLLDREEFEAAYDANLHAVSERKRTREQEPKRDLPAALYHKDSFECVVVKRAWKDVGEEVEALREKTTLMGLFAQIGVV